MDVSFTLRQLQYFVAVADCGSVTAAADACGASQAGVSLAIRDLEKNLGAQLLVRRRARGSVLTEVGRHVLLEARRVLADAEQLQMSADESSGLLVGKLEIGCYVNLAPLITPPVLDTFAQQHPGLEVRVAEDVAAVVVDDLLSGRTEVAFLYASDAPQGIESLPVQRTRPHLLLAASHRLADRDSIHLAELADEPMVMFDGPSVRNAIALFAEVGIEPEVTHRSKHIEVVRSLVARGVGFTIMLQRWPSMTSFDGRPLVAKPIADDIAERDAIVAWPQGVRLTRRAQALVKFSLAAWLESGVGNATDPPVAPPSST